jgi:hypothetical protein
MKNSYKIMILIVSIILISMLAMNVSKSEPPFRAKERIEQLKKIKLLDLLQLDENRSAKFLSKYNELDRKSEELRLEMDHETEVLELLINSEGSKEEISKQTTKVIETQEKFHKSMSDKMKEIKPLLNEIEYAKFVIFESRFHEEVRRIIMKNYRNRHEGRKFRDDGDE